MYFSSCYMFSDDGISPADTISQPSANYTYVSPGLEFPPADSQSLELGRAVIVSPSACFAPLEDMPPSLATSSSHRVSDKASSARLRTSNKRFKDGSAKARKVKSTAEEKRLVSRKTHSQVEKKYRDRLNDQFERLLATLAASSKSDPESMDDDSQRPLSKSAVLGLARRRLMGLEKENRKLATEVERLTAILEQLGDSTGTGYLTAMVPCYRTLVK